MKQKGKRWEEAVVKGEQQRKVGGGWCQAVWATGVEAKGSYPRDGYIQDIQVSAER